MKKKLWLYFLSVAIVMAFCVPAPLHADDPVTLNYNGGPYTSGINLDDDYDLLVGEWAFTAQFGNVTIINSSGLAAISATSEDHGPWRLVTGAGSIINSNKAGIDLVSGTVLNSGRILTALGDEELGYGGGYVSGLYGVHIGGDAIYHDQDTNTDIGFTNNSGASISTTAYVNLSALSFGNRYINQVYGVAIEGDAQSFSNAATITTVLNETSGDWARISMVDGVSIWGDVNEDFTNDGTISTSVVAADHVDLRYVYGVRIGGDVIGFYNNAGSSITASVTVGDYSNWWNYVSEVAGVKILGSVGNITDDATTFLNDGLISASVETGTSNWLPVRDIYGVDIGGDVDTFENTATGIIAAEVQTGADGVEDVYGVRIGGAAPIFTNAGSITATVGAIEGGTIGGDVEGIYGVSIDGEDAPANIVNNFITNDDLSVTAGTIQAAVVTDTGIDGAAIDDSSASVCMVGARIDGDVEDIYGVRIGGRSEISSEIDNSAAGDISELVTNDVTNSVTNPDLGVITAGILTDATISNVTVTGSNNSAYITGTRIEGDVEGIYGVRISGSTESDSDIYNDVTNTTASTVFTNSVTNTLTNTVANTVANAGAVTAGVITNVTIGSITVKDVPVAGDDPIVVTGNSAYITGVHIDGDVEDIYGVRISGNNDSFNDIDNTVVNESGAAAFSNTVTNTVEENTVTNTVTNTGAIQAGIMTEVTLTDVNIGNGNSACITGAHIDGDVENVYGVYISGDNEARSFVDNSVTNNDSTNIITNSLTSDVTNSVNNTVTNSNSIEAGIITIIDGVAANAEVTGVHVEGDLSDVYGVYISGDNQSRSDYDETITYITDGTIINTSPRTFTNTVNNSVDNSGTIKAGFLTSVTIDGATIIDEGIPEGSSSYVYDDVKDIYGVYISGDNRSRGDVDESLISNSVTNSLIVDQETGATTGGLIAAGVITSVKIDNVTIDAEGTSLEVGIPEGGQFGYVGDDVEDVYGIFIDGDKRGCGDGSVTNTVTNNTDGVILAGVMTSATIDVISSATVTDVTLYDGSRFVEVEGDVEDVYGVSIGGHEAVANTVTNDGTIMAGVMAEVAVTTPQDATFSLSVIDQTTLNDVDGSVKDIYGISIDGDYAGWDSEGAVIGGNAVTNNGIIKAGVTNSQIDGSMCGWGGNVKDIYGISIEGYGAAANTVVNTLEIWAGVANSDVNGRVKDVYGIYIGGDRAGAGADISIDADNPTLTGVVLGNSVTNSGAILSGVTNSYVGDGVKDIYGVYIDGDRAGKCIDGEVFDLTAESQASIIDAVFGNKVTNFGVITAGVTDSYVDDDVKDIYGVFIDGDSAGKHAEGQATLPVGATANVSDVIFGNKVVNSASIEASVRESDVDGNVEDIYGISIGGDDAGAHPDGAFEVTGEGTPAVPEITDVVFGNKVVNTGTITAGVINSDVDGQCEYSGDVKDVYGIAISGHDAGKGGLVDVGAFDVVFGNIVENSGTIKAGVFTDAAIDGVTIADVLADLTDDSVDNPTPTGELDITLSAPPTGGSYVNDDVKRIYGVSIDGDNALTNTVINNGVDTIMAGVFTSVAITGVEITATGAGESIVVDIPYGEGATYIGGDIEDIYGIAIDGDQYGCGDDTVTNSVTNSGTILAGIMTIATIDVISSPTVTDVTLTSGSGFVEVEGDIEDVYGVSISGNDAVANTVTNSGNIMAGVFTDLTVTGEVAVTNETTLTDIDGDVEDVYGIAIEGDDAGKWADVTVDDENPAAQNFVFGNNVVNTGNITAGVSQAELDGGCRNGDVKDIYGIAIDGEDAGVGANVAITGYGGALILNNVVFGNKVINSGIIEAGVTDSYVGGDVKGIYGIAIDGDDAGKWADGIATLTEGVEAPTSVTVTDVVFGNKVINSGAITAGVTNSEVEDDVKDVYGIAIDGDDAGRSADGTATLIAGLTDATAVTVDVDNVLFGNKVINSGDITVGVTDSDVDGDVEDIYGIAISGDDAGKRPDGSFIMDEGAQLPTISLDDVVFGNKVVNTGTITAGVINSDVDGHCWGGDVKDVYGIAISGHDAGKGGLADVGAFDVFFGNIVDNSGTISAGVFTHAAIDGQTVSVVLDDLTDDSVDNPEPTGEVNITGGTFTGGTSYVNDDVKRIYGVSIDGDNALNNTVVNGSAATIEAGVFTEVDITNETITTTDSGGGDVPGPFTSIGGDVKDIYGVAIDGDQYGCGENAVMNTVDNSGNIWAGVFTEGTIGVISITPELTLPEGMWLSKIDGDVKDVYGVFINGNYAAANTVTNSGAIAAGVFADEVTITGLPGEALPNYVGGEVEGVYGVYIGGDSSDNTVTNSGIIVAGVTSTEVAGDVEDIYGVYICGTLAASGANTVTNSGDIWAGIANSSVGGEVERVYGVYIGGDGADLNTVTNSGTIIAEVADTEVVGDDEPAVHTYGVYISGIAAATNEVYNSGTIKGEIGVSVGTQFDDYTSVDYEAEVENSGTIIGTSGTAIELRDGYGGYYVELLTGSKLYGEETDGVYEPGKIMGAEHGYNYLELNSANDPVAIGPDGVIDADTMTADQIVNFDDLQKTGPGTWVITAANRALEDGEPDLNLRGNLAIDEGMLAIGGTVHVVHDYSQGKAAIPAIDETPATPATTGTLGLIVTPTTSGRVILDGTATIEEGSKVLVIPQLPKQGEKYAKTTEYGTVFEAETLNGSFDEDVQSTSPFLIPTLTKDEDGDSYDLSLERNLGVFGGTGNGNAIAAALGRFYDNATGERLDRLNNLLFSMTEADGRRLMNQLGGLSFTALPGSTFSGINQYHGTLTGRMGGFVSNGTGDTGFATFMGPMLAMSTDGTMSDVGRNLLYASAMQPLPAAGAATDKTKWGFWAKVYGGLGENDGDNAATRYDYDTGGVALGFDRKISSKLLVGASFGYAYTKVDMDDLNDNIKINSYEGSLYGVCNLDPWYVNGIVSYGYNAYETSRDISLLGFTADGDYSGNSYSGYAEAGYRYKVNKTFEVIPMASLQGSYLTTDSFTETGADGLNLHVDKDSASSVISTLGVRVRGNFAAAGAKITPEIRARWAHEFSNDDHTVDANFGGSSDSSFAIKGEEPASDGAILGAGLSAEIQNNLSIFVDYDANLAGDLTEHKGTVGLRYMW